MATVHVPANISTLQASLKAKLANPDAGKKEEKPDAERDRKRRISDLRKQKDAAEQSKEELAQKLADIQAELEEAKAARVAAEQKASELEPKAKNWSDYEHKERQVLLSKLPAEFKKEAGDMDMKHLKLFVNTVAPPGGKTQTGETFDRSKMTDDDMAKLAETNPAKFLELIEKK